MNIISVFFNVVHIFLIILPILIFFINKNIIKPYAKWILLMSIMIPLHWPFFDNYCIFTILSKKAGDMKDKKTTSPFSEKYLKWIYKPIMDIIGWKWGEKGLGKMTTLNWIINIFLCWYYCFYY